MPIFVQLRNISGAILEFEMDIHATVFFFTKCKPAHRFLQPRGNAPPLWMRHYRRQLRRSSTQILLTPYIPLSGESASVGNWIGSWIARRTGTLPTAFHLLGASMLVADLERAKHAVCELQSLLGDGVRRMPRFLR